MIEPWILASSQLARRHIHSREAVMILGVMLDEGLSYSEALAAYSQFRGMSRTRMEWMMNEAARTAGLWTGIRYILEDCYREAINENGIPS